MNLVERVTDEICRRLFLEVEASGRHIHLTEEQAQTLFGHSLTNVRPLSQPGQYVCAERVTLVGPKGKLERVAVLGPARKEAQVEVSRTDCHTLGIDAPVRLSGHVEGTPGITLMGDHGQVQLNQGVMVAQRHIHMTPEDAALHGLKNGDTVSLKCLSSRPVILEGVSVRVSPQFATFAHIDLDEANGCGHKKGDLGMIVHG